MQLFMLSLATYLTLLTVKAHNENHGGGSTVEKGMDKSLRYVPQRQLGHVRNVFKPGQGLSRSLLNTTCGIYHTKHGLLRADCSNKGISDIAALRLLNPERVEKLDLQGNFIKTISVGTWTPYRKLTHLNLKENLLSRLEDHFFIDLNNLKWLSLQGNGLAFTRQNFPEKVFSPLRALKSLFLSNNTNSNYKGRWARNTDGELRYPDWALSSLTSMKNLYIDGLPETRFGPGFMNMTRLNYLSMNSLFGYCNMSRLHVGLFDNVRQLQRLTMDRCMLTWKGIEPDVLKPLDNLVHLDVSRNVDMEFDGLVTLVSSQLNSTKLTWLSMNMVVNPYSVSRCVSNKLARSLPRSLTRLDAASNNLEIISDQVFELLPQNLSYLGLDNNRFFFGSYLKNMSFMTNLKTLKLNGLSQGYGLPRYFSARDQRPVGNCTISTKGKQEKIVFKLPPNLERLEMNSAYLSLKVTNFSFDPNNSLKYLSVHKNNIPFLIGSVSGLTKLETLDLSRNNVEFIAENFFVHWNIQTLNLSSNDFDSHLNGRSFNLYLPNTLRKLDLSNSNVGSFSMDFLNFTNLEILQLSNSRVKHFVPNLYLFKNMRYLDLSHNSLYTLRSSVTSTMSNLPHLTVDLSGNIIGCVCENLKFIDWLVHYPRLTDKNLSRMACLRDGDIWSVADFKLEYQLLRRECTSHLMPLSILTAVCVSLLLLNFVFIAYRYRWKLRFWYYAAYPFNNSNKEQGPHHEFQADVTIAYCKDDEDFAEQTLANALDARGLRVHIPGRDSRVGTWMFKDIVETVQTCRKTLVVLTPNMLASKWCQATVNFAAQEALSSKRKVLEFLVVKPVESKQLEISLLFLIQNSEVFDYPPEEYQGDERRMGLFWRELARALR